MNMFYSDNVLKYARKLAIKFGTIDFPSYLNFVNSIYREATVLYSQEEVRDCQNLNSMFINMAMVGMPPSEIDRAIEKVKDGT